MTNTDQIAVGSPDSPRAARIAKLDKLIAEAIATDKPNQAAKFTAKRNDFARMSDDFYDNLMAGHARALASGRPVTVPRSDDTLGRAVTRSYTSLA